MLSAVCLSVVVVGQIPGWVPLNYLSLMKGSVAPKSVTVVEKTNFDVTVKGSDTDTYWRNNPASGQYEEKELPSAFVEVKTQTINSGTQIGWNLTSNSESGEITATSSVKAMSVPEDLDEVTVSDYYTVEDKTQTVVLQDGIRTYGVRVTITKAQPTTPPGDPTTPPPGGGG
jgi:hypothetical protein